MKKHTHILKLFSANLKVTGISGPEHHSSLKNATDKYWDVIPGGGMNVMSESNVHLPRDHSSRHYSCCDRRRQGTMEKLSLSAT